MTNSIDWTKRRRLVQYDSPMIQGRHTLFNGPKQQQSTRSTIQAQQL